jgi:hypothetical protein
MRRLQLPLSRDQLLLLMAALNEIFLGIDIYLAHSISGTLVPNEWIPIIFGPIAGALLLIAGLIALKKRAIATVIATVIFLVSIGVGLLGDYFHIMRAILPNAPASQQVTIDLLVWAPPLLGPLMFVLVGLLGISAAWLEDPPDSGQLVLLRALATVISSVLDHARTHFQNPWLWLPTAIGVYATVIAVAMAAIERPRRSDLIIYASAMILMIGVGLVGALLHIDNNLTSEGTIVGERFIRGAPFLAPLLFANIGLLGLIALLDPAERN